jgi:ribosomal protein S18 acetylase RimI-like enzyme
MDNQIESFLYHREVRLASKEDLWQVGELARLIFPGTYEHIVPADSIAYMMELFYSPKALESQFDSGQTFLLLYFDGRAAGYASFTKLNDNGDFKLNKIYLDNRLQGKGLGRFLLSDVVSRVKSEGGCTLTLNVNKYNPAVGFYRNLGFYKIKEELLDIGEGHFMDDFVLQLNII